MSYLLLIIIMAHASDVIAKVTVEYNFEGDLPTEITPQDSLKISTSQFKKGSKSMRWQWSAKQTLTWDLSTKNVQVKSNAGIQIWIHNSKPLAEKCLTLCVRQKRKANQKQFCFPFSLNFDGWRAAWVSYSEFLGCPAPSSTKPVPVRGSPNYAGTIDMFSITAPSGVTSPGILHIDFLRFVDKLSMATRDLIIPPLTYVQSTKTLCTDCSKISSGLTQDDALLKHKRKSFWQQIYRWSLQTPFPAIASKVDKGKMKAIDEITRRLLDWYASETKAYTTIPHKLSKTDPFPKQRWGDLVTYFNEARTHYKNLTKGDSNTPTSGLFSRNDKSKVRGGPEEFSFVHHKVLLPLTLEFHLKSRTVEIEHVACELAKKYACSKTKSLNDEDVEAITGEDDSLKRSFKSFYTRSFTSTNKGMHPKCSSAKKDCVEHVKKALQDINKLRKTKIIGLFEYLKNQGLNKGSGLGSMDHELLQMTGFLHSVFLMRNYLKSDTIDMMKWYVEFGEVYQKKFEFKGSTADRIRSAMLYRLMTVLAMPEKNDAQKKEKIRDMDAFKRWVENALDVTEGLSGLVKPDYTVFHHKTFYASAYGPQALHTVALVSYLLEETAYELKSETKLNIIDSLKVLRIASVRYSTPSQVGGRFPKYNKAVLTEIVPAYAYMAMKSPLKEKDKYNNPNLNIHLAQVRMFLRLYTPVPGTCEGNLNSRLCKGTPSRIYYLNTLGSLGIMERVKRLASTYKKGPQKWYYRAEDSPIGHWSKQFGSLSIHRRDDWAVTVKGFDKFVWDFESGKDNVYGMYGSHGAMLIANSEAALNSKDIDKGWDWRKIPGTTVMDVPYADMATYAQSSSRQYNPSVNAMAGGLFLHGSKSKMKFRNGVFGMDFKQPTYGGKKNSPFSKPLNFVFKKSVYFYDDIIVSLGSDIKYSGGKYEIHTTLFQDLMPSASSPATKDTAPNIFHCNAGGPLKKTSWSGIELAILVDVNGNRYYVPKPDQQRLVLHRNQRQDSIKGKKATPDPTHGTYCTAWFNHGKNPSRKTAKYQYAVHVGAETVKGQTKPLFKLNDRYSVLKQGANRHIVHFKKHSGRGDVYAYVVFQTGRTVGLGQTGPIESVKQQSIIMAEETTNPKALYISVKSPQLKLEEIKNSPSWCKGGTTTPSKNGDVDETLLYCSRSADQSIQLNLRNFKKWSKVESLRVGGKNKSSTKSDYLKPAGAPKKKLIEFTKLRNGAETEVAFG